MRKTYTWTIIISALILILICIKPMVNFTVDSFWNFIATQFDKEEKEREQKIENGEIVRGKDTVLIWENRYEIWRHMGEERLSIEAPGVTSNILEKIMDSKVIDDHLYIVSKEGYAIIDKNNICRVFITVPKDGFVNEYSIDEEGNTIYNSKFIEDEHILYLEEFSEFSAEEQENLLNMQAE